MFLLSMLLVVLVQRAAIMLNTSVLLLSILLDKIHHVHLFKVYNSSVVSRFTMLCNQFVLEQ